MDMKINNRTQYYLRIPCILLLGTNAGEQLLC